MAMTAQRLMSAQTGPVAMGPDPERKNPLLAPPVAQDAHQVIKPRSNWRNVTIREKEYVQQPLYPFSKPLHTQVSPSYPVLLPGFHVSVHGTQGVLLAKDEKPASGT